MSKIKNVVYATVGGASLLASNVFAAGMFEKSATVGSGIKGTDNSADKVAQSWLSYLVGFLYLVAVVYGLYG